jgi:hypothetical protein
LIGAKLSWRSKNCFEVHIRSSSDREFPTVTLISMSDSEVTGLPVTYFNVDVVPYGHRKLPNRFVFSGNLGVASFWNWGGRQSFHPSRKISRCYNKISLGCVHLTFYAHLVNAESLNDLYTTSLLPFSEIYNRVGFDKLIQHFGGTHRHQLQSHFCSEDGGGMFLRKFDTLVYVPNYTTSHPNRKQS